MSEEQFANIDSFSGGSSGKFVLNFKMIVMMHINRCTINGSVEYHGGYWQEFGNPVQRSYVQNSRDVYCNSVKMLRALLLGYFDKTMTDADKKLEKDFSDKKEAYSNKKDKKKEDMYTFMNESTEWHLKLFEQLIMLSKRLNFFEESSAEISE